MFFLSISAFAQSMATVVLLVIMINLIIALQKLHYSIEYIGGAIFLAFLLIVRLVIASKSKAAQVRRKVETKTD